MANIRRVQSEEVLKILGDPTRLAILRLLISRSATLTQLGELFGKHPAQIRNHIKRLEKEELIELESVQTVKNYTEKYYRATARAYFINLAVFPEPPEAGQLVVLGSDDPALDLLASLLSQKENMPSLYVLPVGGLDGLLYLRERYCHMTGCHLYDFDSGEYNIPYVRHLFTDRSMILVTLTHRQQGLLVKSGNPLNIHDIKDLTRADITLANSRRGTSKRLWLEQNLRQSGVDFNKIRGFDQEFPDHSSVGFAIARGLADVGMGLWHAAYKYDLDFIPIYEERYDLVMPEEVFVSSTFVPILNTIRSKEFRQQAQCLGGYNTTHSGEIIWV